MSQKQAKKKRKIYKKEINDLFDRIGDEKFLTRLSLAWGVLWGKNNLIKDTKKVH